MTEIELKPKSYEELQAEIFRLITINCLLESKVKKAINYIKNFELYYDDELGLVNMLGAGNTRTPVVLSRGLLNILQEDENILGDDNNAKD